MGTRHKHKNVDTTDSAILTHSWINFNDVPLFYIVCNHMHTNISSQSFWSNRIESLYHGLMCLLYCNSNQRTHVCNNWIPMHGMENVKFAAPLAVFSSTPTPSYMRHINTWHRDLILLDRNFITRQYTVAKQLILFKNMSESRRL